MAGTRIQAEVEVKGIYSYQRAAYGYGTETAYIYNMVAEDGTVYVWKTTAFMAIEVPYTGKPGFHNFEDRKGNPIEYSQINKGDKVVITASVKEQSEYKGQPQTVVTRVKVKERTFAAETWEERKARKEAEKKAKAQEQKDSLAGKDFIWRMPYKQYKEHYSDCETVANSYDSGVRNGRKLHVATIEVIVREGRLKASGVRGKHFSGFELRNEAGERTVYTAVSEENAIRRAEKDFGGAWECTHIYNYR